MTGKVGQPADQGLRVPPHAEDAEKSLLGAILVDDKVLPLVHPDVLEAADFYLESHRVIFETMVELSGRGSAIDAVTLAEALRTRGLYDRVGGAAYLDQVMDAVPMSADAEEHARLIREKSIVRRLILACGRVVAGAFQDYGEIDSFLDSSEQIVFEVSRERSRVESSHISATVKEVFTELDLLSQSSREVIGVPTGFQALDRVTAGFQKSDLIVLAGRPSVGKTSFCTNLAFNAASIGRVPVAFFSIEMSKAQLVRRALASEAGVDGRKLRTGHGLTADDWKRLMVAADRIKKLDVFLDDSAMLNVAQLRSRTRRLVAKHGVGLVAIDYLQLMRPTRSYDSREREVAEISRNLKALAKELDIPVIALSQLSRDVDKRQDKRPVLADLRESGAIEQDSDLVIFLHDPHGREVDLSRREIELIVAKHRSGPTASIPLMFSREFTRFDSVATREREPDEIALGPSDEPAF